MLKYVVEQSIKWISAFNEYKRQRRFLSYCHGTEAD